MNRNLPALLITLTLVILSSELLNAWQHSPYDQLGGLAFIIWIASPTIGRRFGTAKPPWLHPLAAALAAIGWVVGEFHFIIYLGLALAVAGFVAPRISQLCCILTCFAWMPLFGYILSLLNCSPQQTMIARLILASIGLASLLIPRAADSTKHSS